MGQAYTFIGLYILYLFIKIIIDVVIVDTHIHLQGKNVMKILKTHNNRKQYISGNDTVDGGYWCILFSIFVYIL